MTETWPSLLAALALTGVGVGFAWVVIGILDKLGR